ncbi:MAG: acyltransferase family protein [Acidobacteriaceae bacterium]
MKTPIQRKAKATGYLPTLDGWRAIAVIGVMAFHSARISFLHLGAIQNSGDLGVNLFFAISGILICSRLLQEEQVHGRISLKRFYIRRVFRILPPAFAYLLLIALLGKIHIVRVVRGAWLAAAFFYRNYYFIRHSNVQWARLTNHFWSLSVEEHFYLLLPAALLLFRNRKRLVALISVLVLLLARIFYVIAHPALIEKLGGFTGMSCRTDVQIVSLLWPAILAIALSEEDVRLRVAYWIRPRFMLPLFAVIGVIVLAAQRLLDMHLGTFLYFVIIPLLFPIIILATVFYAKSIPGRILEWAPLRWIGRLSYSIYLYQQLFFTDVRSHSVLRYLQRFPEDIIAVSFCAVASYYLIERPFMRLGHRLAPPVTAGRADLADTPVSTRVGTAVSLV